MTQDEFRSLPFAEARAKLLEEMGLASDYATTMYRHEVYGSKGGIPTTFVSKVPPSLWPLRFGREA